MKKRQTEAAITKRIGGYLGQLKAKGEPIFYVKLHGGPMQRAGLPDWLIIYQGVTLAVEVKTATGKVTKLQDHTLSEIQRAGALIAVVRSVEEVVRLLEATKRYF